MSTTTQKTTGKSKTWATAFDPGLITGVAAGWFTATLPLVVSYRAALTYDVLETYARHEISSQYGEASRLTGNILSPTDIVISEKFTLRTNNEFAADLSAVRVEALLELVYQDNDIVYRERTTKRQVSDQILKDHGLWVTGSDVHWEDGRDVNDAIIHLLGHVAFDLHHIPTLRKYFK